MVGSVAEVPGGVGGDGLVAAPAADGGGGDEVFPVCSVVLVLGAVHGSSAGSAACGVFVGGGWLAACSADVEGHGWDGS